MKIAGDKMGTLVTPAMMMTTVNISPIRPKIKGRFRHEGQILADDVCFNPDTRIEKILYNRAGWTATTKELEFAQHYFLKQHALYIALLVMGVALLFLSTANYVGWCLR